MPPYTHLTNNNIKLPTLCTTLQAHITRLYLIKKWPQFISLMILLKELSKNENDLSLDFNMINSVS